MGSLLNTASMYTAFLVLLGVMTTYISASPRSYLIKTKEGEVEQKSEIKLQEDVREAPRRRSQLISPWHDKFHKLASEKEGRGVESSASKEVEEDPQPEVYDPQPEVHDPQPEVYDPQPEVHDLQPEVHDPQPEVSSPTKEFDHAEEAEGSYEPATGTVAPLQYGDSDELITKLQWLS